MSDLISRKALLEAFKSDQNSEYYNFGEAMELVINAPAIEQGENDFPYSANLDIYNSVHFSDGRRGTMIMESKIVKWLCRNKSKDYFDEMMKGK